MNTEYIEEMIEESYLLGLSEPDIRANLDRFVETCGRVIRKNVHNKKQMHILAEKLARARALSLIEDQQEDDETEDLLPKDNPLKSPQEQLAEKVARNKRLILRAIGECNPKLVHLIEQERFPRQTQDPLPPMAMPIAPSGHQTFKDLVLKASYVVALVLVLLIIYLVLLQNV